MNAEMVALIIQQVLTPALLTTTCGVMMNALMAHYTGINDRLRAMARERIDLLRAASQGHHDPFNEERICEIDTQAPQLLRRHKLMHDAIVTIFSAIVLFIGSMLVIAVAALTHIPWVATAAMCTFLAGTLTLLIGVFLTTLQLRISHQVVQYEMKRVMELSMQASIPTSGA